MELLRRAKWQLFLLLSSIVGAGIAIYLTFVHYENVPLVCSESGFVNCARVLASPYSVVPGTSIPITIPGLAWYIVMAGLAVTGVYLAQLPRWLRQAQFAWTLLGMLTVLYLVYAEIVKLHNLCAWCTALHVLILLMFLVTLVQLQSPADTADLDEEAEEDVIEPARSNR